MECGCHHTSWTQLNRSETETPGQPAGGRLYTEDSDNRVTDPDLGGQSGVVQQARNGG